MKKNQQTNEQTKNSIRIWLYGLICRKLSFLSTIIVIIIIIIFYLFFIIF